MSTESERKRRRRQRQTLVCEFCRKRKVKCDKGNPCSTCRKYKNTDCLYAETGINGLSNGNEGMIHVMNINSGAPPIPGSQMTAPYMSADSTGESVLVANSIEPPQYSTQSSVATKSDLEMELERLKEKIKNIEESVTSYEKPLTPHSNSTASLPKKEDGSSTTSNRSSIATFMGGTGNSISPSMSNSGPSPKSLFATGHSLTQNSLPPVPPLIPAPISSSAPTKTYPGASTTNNQGPNATQVPGPAQAPSPFAPILRGFTSLPPPFTVPPTLQMPNCKFNSLLGHNPVASEYDTINFYSGYTSIYDKEPMRRANSGPLSWLSLMRKDEGLSLFMDFLQSRKKFQEEKMKVFLPGPNANTTEKRFGEAASESFGLNDIKLYKNSKEEVVKPSKVQILSKPLYKEEAAEAKSKFNERATSLGLSFYAGQLEDEMALLEVIELILPPESVIWLLIERFFSHMYPFFPIIDEEYFRRDISKIIGPEGYDNRKKVKLTIEKKLDFATLGLLLLMLRFGYLTLLTTIDSVNDKNLHSTDPSPQAQRLKFLLSNPINIDTVDAAQNCLNQFNLLRRVNMAVMQLAFFTRCYHMYAPEDGDGADGGDSQVFTATLVQMALSLGLNREPDNFPDVCNDEKMNNIGRKTWYLLLILDMNNAMSLGSPLNIHRSMFDTKFPFYKKGNENILDVDLEMKVLSTTFPRIDRIYDPMSDIIQQVLNVNGDINMASLAQKLNFMEMYFIQEYGRLRSYFAENEECENEPSFLKTIKMKIYFSSNFFLVSLFFHFFCYYEKKKNIEYAFYYLKKIFVITHGDLMPYYFELLENNPKVFRDSTDLIVTPGFELVIQKSNIVNSAILIRIRSWLLSLRWSENHDKLLLSSQEYRDLFMKLTKLDQLLQRCNKVFQEAAARLSKRYYYAWRQVKAGAFVFDILKGTEFYRVAQDRMKSFDAKFSQSMLDDMISLFEEALSRVPHHQHHHKKESKKAAGTTPLGATEPPAFTQDKDTLLNTPTGSTSSTDYMFTDMGTTGELIDNIWLQMLSIKRDNNPPTNSNFSMTDGFKSAHTPSFDAGSTMNFQDGNNNIPAGFETGDLAYDTLRNTFEIFDGLSFDDLFRK